MAKYLFGQAYQHTLAETASGYVKQFQAEQAKKLANAKDYLTSPQSVLRSMILNAAKKGEIRVKIDFELLNHNMQFGNFDYLFTPTQLDELLMTSTQYLEKEGCNYTIEGMILIVTWSDPSTPPQLSSPPPLSSSPSPPPLSSSPSPPVSPVPTQSD